MGTQSGSWYLRGDGNQPAGPFTAEQLIQSWRAGRLEASTICWREGMSQWLPLAQVEPFASAIASASVPRQVAAAAARPPAPPMAPPVRSAPPSGKRRHISAAWVGWAVAAGLAGICALVAGVVLRFNAPAIVKPNAAADGGGPESQDWSNPARVQIAGENREVRTTFLVGLKDAWYSGCQRSEEGVERNTLVVVYQYKNLGPREELEPLAWGDVRKEIKTDKGHIFPGGSLCGSPQALFAMPEGKRRAFWWPKATRKFEETGESALVFAIPKDEVPTEVVAAGRICGGRIDLNLKLPQGPVGSRSYSKAFGFLPRTAEKAVPVFIEALQDHREDIRKAAS